MFTKRHHEALAEVVKTLPLPEVYRQVVAGHLSAMLCHDNPRFQPGTFAFAARLVSVNQAKDMNDAAWRKARERDKVAKATLAYSIRQPGTLEEMVEPPTSGGRKEGRGG